MDRELEEQIDELIHKATKDLKTRLVRVVSRHQAKLLKDQARDLKSGTTGGTTSSTTRKTVNTVAPVNGGRGKSVTATSEKSAKSKKDSKYHSDSDSDGYYSD